jgi:RNase H-like domain found in reverse transcriptase
MYDSDSGIIPHNWAPRVLSRKLRGAGLRYDTPDVELMAIVEAFRTWTPYLAYVETTVAHRRLSLMAIDILSILPMSDEL